VTNTSSVAGDAVAQIYIHQRYGSASRPVRQLKGFERIALQPGETKTLKFPLGKDELKYWNPQTKQWIVEPSEFDVWAGEDSKASLHADLRVTQSCECTPGARVLSNPDSLAALETENARKTDSRVGSRWRQQL
jgi:hypothetical protein